MTDSSAFERALRLESVMRHRDEHKDVAKVVRLTGLPHWCFLCGFTPGVAQPVTE